ncbi:hypothetical protein ACIBI0_38485 [Microbispora rosea]|uniref:DUF7620 family protein n=1 Tax=Microbispora rosea TaxID=58117 RepID=UPI0037A30B07
MPDTDIDAARKVRRRMEHVWRAARDQRAEVANLAATLRGIREENHLLAIFQESLRERGPDD